MPRLFQWIGKKIVFLLFPAFLLPAALPATAAPAPMREITVGVAVAPGFKSSPDWKATFKKRLKYASLVFEREFRIRLKEVIFFDWRPSNENGETALLLNELMQNFTLGERKVDLMIGLTKLTDLSTAMNIRDLHVLGRARPFSGYMVLRYPDHPLFRVQEETVLVHELGHLFGAMHTDQPDTIMAPVADRQIPTTFDAENRQILSLTREVDFQKGTETMDPRTVQTLVHSYMKMAGQKQPVEFYFALARFYLQLGEDQQAVRTLEQLAALDTGDPRIYYDLGLLYYRTGDMDKARKTLNIAISKMDETGDKAGRASAYGTLGGIYFREGNMEGAHYAFSRALALDPDNLDTRINLAIVQLKRGQVSAAQNDLERALRQDPRNIKITVHLAAAALTKKDYAKAIEYYKNSMGLIQERSAGGVISEEDKDYLGEIYGGLGMAFWQMGDRGQAAGFFQRACAAEPSASCHEKMGRIYFEIKEWDASIRELAAAIQLKPDNAELFAVLGMALMQKGNQEQALAAFQEGLRYTNDMEKASRLHSNSGHIYMQLKRPEMAVAEFMSAISRDWKNKEAHLGLGLAYLAKLQPVEAKQAFLNVLSIDPRNEQAREMAQKADIMQEEIRRQQQEQMTVQFYS